MGHDIDKSSSPAVLRIVPASRSGDCRYWVGFFRRGETSPQQLFLLPSVEEIFAVAGQGLAESEAMMLSDTDSTPPRFFSLVPAPDRVSQQVDSETVNMLVAALRTWESNRVGFYLAPELIAGKIAQEMLLQILRESLLTTEAREFYLLVGDMNRNDLLNNVIWLKEHLEKESINVCIYH